MLEDGDTVVVAVSGGPDSTCLLDVLRRVSSRRDLDLVVAHVDHRLGADSEEVAGRVAATAAREGLDVHVARAPELEGPNLHERAREFRYAFFSGLAERFGGARIATGHTLDDRVETTLARLVHGAGTEGLAGIPPVEGARVRPLIGCRRRETRAYCEEVGLEFFDDPANDDPRFERSVIRHDVLSALEARWGDGGIRAMATSSERLREDGAALRTLAETLYSDLARGEEGTITFDRALLVALPRALRRRLLERAVGRIRDRSGGIDPALDALEDESPEKRSFDVAGGATIVVAPEAVRIVGAGGPESAY